MADGFASAVDELLGMYAPQVTQAQLNLLDSHDTARLLTLARGDESALRLSWLFMMCYPGAPCIYYGDEIGVVGGKDPDCRRAFPWEERQWNLDLRNYVKGCIALRKAHPALRRGDFKRLFAQGEIYAFARQLGEEKLVVLLNAGQTPWAFDVPLEGWLPDGTVLDAVWGEGTATVGDGRLAGLSVPARGGVMLKVRGA
jgi:neopullulanase